jgi:hypothetical protein
MGLPRSENERDNQEQSPIGSEKTAGGEGDSTDNGHWVCRRAVKVPFEDTVHQSGNVKGWVNNPNAKVSARLCDE